MEESRATTEWSNDLFLVFLPLVEHRLSQTIHSVKSTDIRRVITRHLPSFNAVLRASYIDEEGPFRPGFGSGVFDTIIVMWAKKLARRVPVQPYVGVQRVELGRRREILLVRRHRGRMWIQRSPELLSELQ
jgi:hypothetical protein